MKNHKNEMNKKILTEAFCSNACKLFQCLGPKSIFMFPPKVSQNFSIHAMDKLLFSIFDAKSTTLLVAD